MAEVAEWHAMKPVLVVVLIGAITALSGCRNNQAAMMSALEQKTENLENRLLELEATSTINEPIWNDFLRVRQLLKNEAAFDPTEGPLYQRVHGSQGDPFLVSIENVRQYMDGYRLTLNLGNPSSVVFDGFRVHAKWGPRLTKENASKWSDLLRSRDLKLSNILRAGSWNPVTITLSPASVDNFTFLEISITTDTVRLSR